MRRTVRGFIVLVIGVVALGLALLGIAAGGLGILSPGPSLPEHNKVYVLPPGLPEGTLLVIVWRCSQGTPLTQGPNHIFVFHFDRRGVACTGTPSWNGQLGETSTERYTVADAVGRVTPHAAYHDVVSFANDNNPQNALRDLTNISESSASYYSAYTLFFWGSADHLDRLWGETGGGATRPDTYLPYLQHVLGREYRPVAGG